MVCAVSANADAQKNKVYVAKADTISRVQNTFDHAIHLPCLAKIPPVAGAGLTCAIPSGRLCAGTSASELGRMDEAASHRSAPHWNCGRMLCRAQETDNC